MPLSIFVYFEIQNHRSEARCALFGNPGNETTLKPLPHVGRKASTYRADY